MTMYVAEIEGRAIVAFNAENDAGAYAIAEEDWFKSDLRVLESEGAPLWDGVSEIHIREAIEEERGKWDASRAQARIEGEDADDWVAYLVPVSDPTDNDLEDEDDEDA